MNRPPRPTDIAQALSKNSDVLLAVFVIAIIGAMLIPLPTILLDLLLTLNLAVAATLLLVALYLRDATKIAAFPAILLITTLFRLSLNIATTRLILLHANAGEVVRAFGEFVAGGDIIVGSVIFFIITIVQFVVVTKGAERVSEVAARFTLDAIPGKQMSIDAEVNKGVIDFNEARRRRAALQRESQLYGAMDGAMKFVKGDAIAGIIITTINILAGFAIGVLSRGMPLGKAASTYSILTIGDGLVTQIPALLISIAAALVVTRVASEEPDTQLGKDIGRQILAEPRAIQIVSVLLLAMGFVPGLPLIPFVGLGLIASGVAHHLNQTRKREAAESEKVVAKGKPTQLFSPAYPVAIALSDTLTSLVKRGSDGGTALAELIPRLRQELYWELGISVPDIEIRENQPIQPMAFTMLLRDVPLETVIIPRGKQLVVAPVESLAPLKIEAEATRHPVTDEAAAWISVADEERARNAGYEVLGTAAIVAAFAKGLLRRHADELIGLSEVKSLLDELRRSHPGLVDEVVPKIVQPHELVEILQRLIREEVSIRDLRGILEALSAWRNTGEDPLHLTERVRQALQRQICSTLGQRSGKIRVYCVDPFIEQQVTAAFKRTVGGYKPGLDAELQSDLFKAIQRQLGSRPASAGRAVVYVSTPDARPWVRFYVHKVFPRAAVISVAEVAGLVVMPIGTITLADPQRSAETASGDV